MRLKVGLISETKQDVDRIKAEFDELHIYYATNVMDFYKVLGSNKVDALIFIDGSQNPRKLTQEFSSYHNYIRQKPLFKTIPMAVFSSSSIISRHIVEDPLVRFHDVNNGFFMPLMGLFEAIQGKRNLKNLLETKQIEDEFKSALAQSVGQNSNFASRPATDDEAHSEFLGQLSDEIACNLVWIKYAARILQEGSEIFVKSSGVITEEQLSVHTGEVLAAAFEKFSGNIIQNLKEEGAFFFTKSDALPGPEKAAFIKSAKSQTILFESPVCRILVEFIRYI